ncbi:MAG: hypothetical protein K6B13_10395 [Prevotella sp.]|nr:hypothetical protein [Prevotella sp.]
MNRKALFWPLAAMLLTACEKGLVDGVADVAPAGQAANSVLQVRTRSGGSAGEEATVAYPIAVYVFAGEECKAVLTDDEMPANVAKLKFYYLGGSSTFSPKDGCGCVNSKQTEIRPVSDDGIYEIFTLPHTEDDVLTKLTVTALDQNDNTVKEKVFENVPVSRNQVTRYTGSFFGSGGGSSTSDGTFRLTADPDWDSVNGYTF